MGLLTVVCATLAVACGKTDFRADVRVVRTAGTSIAWYERGSGPPLVLLTGTGSTMAEWDPALLRLLARSHRLILFDYPAVGRSGTWRGRSFDSLADTTAAFMRAVGLRRADALGCIGSFVAQRLAVRHPGLVSHLILAGTNPGGDETVLGSKRAQRIDSEPHPSDREILKLLYPAGAQPEGGAFLTRLDRASEDGEIPDDFHVPAATTDAQVAAEDPWLRSNANYRDLGTLIVPTLAAAGAADPVVPPVNLRRIARRVPGARLAIFPGAHAFLFESRRSFARAVDEFLRLRR
jgi:pimeloyl-ACP methyl ester carboxylesterase